MTSSSTPKFYDYQPDQGKESVWVDFANKYLGGGWRGNGFVQEEIMFAEFPDLAAYGAVHSDLTREGGQNVGQGSPTPLLIKDVHRVQVVDSKELYGRKLLGKSSGAEAVKHVTSLDVPQAAHILAMAAPYNPAKPKSADTFYDLFNTAYASFELARENTPQGMPVIIHSGKWGAGVFGNDPTVVCIAQLLAAQHAGVDIKFHGYSDQEFQKAHTIFETLATEAPSNIKAVLDRASELC
ncbi:MAG: hypothetical protein ACQEP8_04695 [Chlamydiota bacterium]